jgi:SpoVK/Ycf46/Vps4 family AAA+-type ATPase
MGFLSRKKGGAPFSPSDAPTEYPPNLSPDLASATDWPAPSADVLEGFPIVFDGTKAGEVYRSLEKTTDDEATLFNTLLKSPVEGVTLGVHRSVGRFCLLGEVKFGDSATTVESLEAFQQELMRRLGVNEFDERGGASIVAGQNKTPFIVARGKSYSSKENSIVVTTGRLRDGYRTYAEVLRDLEYSKETFQQAMEDELLYLALALAVSYRKAGVKPPDQTIDLTVPPPRPKLALGGFTDRDSDESEKPEDISKKFGAEYPKVSFADIGGQAKAKEEVKSLVSAIVHPEIYSKWGTKPPKGILLYGPPGTGKTLLAKALASEADAAFYAISPSDIGSKWYGESEKLVKDIFEEAAKQKRAIIYFDELDAIVPDRNNGAHEATKRIISMVLQHIDGMESKDNVLIIASTNRLEAIDTAMRRPGRLDRLIEVALPDTPDRKTIFEIHKRNAEERAGRSLFDTAIDTEELARITPGQSGADIAEVLRRVLENKVREESLTGIEPATVTAAELKNEINSYERTSKNKFRTGFTLDRD